MVKEAKFIKNEYSIELKLLTSLIQRSKAKLCWWSLLFVQDRVIINRLDSICQAVLKGKWPETRRVYEPGGAVASFYTTKLLDNANSLCEDPSASPQGSKVTKHVAENKEFSVKLNEVCWYFPTSPFPSASP